MARLNLLGGWEVKMEQARDLPIREGAGMDSGSRAGMTALRASVEHGRGPGSDGGQGFGGLG